MNVGRLITEALQADREKDQRRVKQWELHWKYSVRPRFYNDSAVADTLRRMRAFTWIDS